MVEKLMKDLDTAYQGLQHLNVEPNKNNLAILTVALQAMENAYAFLKDLPKGEEGEENA